MDTEAVCDEERFVVLVDMISHRLGHNECHTGAMATGFFNILGKGACSNLTAAFSDLNEDLWGETRECLPLTLLGSGIPAGGVVYRARANMSGLTNCKCHPGTLIPETLELQVNLG